MAKFIILGIIAALILIQFIPVTKTNPAVTADFDGPADVKAAFQKSCYDCHSNETVWPWYSHVAPVSWLVASDVNEGRHHFNFSDWGTYSDLKKAKIAEGVGEMVSEGDMPPSTYLIMHSSAKPDQNEKDIIFNWVKAHGGDIPKGDKDED